MIVFIVLISEACLLSVKYAKSLTLHFWAGSAKFRINSVILTVLLLGLTNVTAATPLLQVGGRLCQSNSKMKDLVEYKEYFREWSGLADGAHVHMLVRKISPQILPELLNYWWFCLVGKKQNKTEKTHPKKPPPSL